MKKGFLILLVLAVLLAFSGCGDAEAPMAAKESSPGLSSVEASLPENGSSNAAPTVMPTPTPGPPSLISGGAVSKPEGPYYLTLLLTDVRDQRLTALELPDAEKEYREMYEFPYTQDIVEDGAELRPGMVVQVTYDGTALTIYPASIAPDHIAVLREEDDLIGLYAELLEHLLGEQEGITFLGIDLQGVPNLTGDEQWAAIRRFGSECNILAYAVTSFEDTSGNILREITPEGDALYLRITADAVSKDSFSFEMEAQRENGGAWGYRDCRAELDGLEWTWNAGDFWEE